MPFITQGKTNWKFLLIVVILVVVAGGGVLAWQYGWIGKSSAPTPTPQVTSIPQPAPTPDETAGWQTYRNEEYGFEMKYPSEYSIKKYTGANDTYLIMIEFSKYDVVEIPMPQPYLSVGVYNEPSDINEWLQQNGLGEGWNKNENFLVDGKKAIYLTGGFELGAKPIVIIPYQNKIFRLENYATSYFDQMLSTFRFIEPIDTSNWQTYRNEEYGFEIKYPSFYEQENTYKSFLSGDGVFTSKYKSTNILNIAIFKDSFKNYRLIDNPGGFIFYFDTEKKQWLHSNGQTSKFVPKKIDIPLESYIYKSGDINCNWDWIVIPHPSYSYVIEIANITCGELSGNDYKQPSFILDSNQLLSTFRFLE